MYQVVQALEANNKQTIGFFNQLDSLLAQPGVERGERYIHEEWNLAVWLDNPLGRVGRQGGERTVFRISVHEHPGNGSFQCNPLLPGKRGRSSGEFVQHSDGRKYLAHKGRFDHRGPDLAKFKERSSPDRWIRVDGTDMYIVTPIGEDLSTTLRWMRGALDDYIHAKTGIGLDRIEVRSDVGGASGNTRGSPPLNTVLYGPPGTGKTYSTAAEAVRLCGEPVPEDREALMQTYQQLLAAGRIEFVTFHQSMSYEDFVEGRQPATGMGEDDDNSTGGFRLETRPGIFRRIARRAETTRGRSQDDDSTTVEGRQVFKMSIGDATNPDDSRVFEEAIKGGYALLGWGGIDWSDGKYADREAIVEARTARGEDVKAQSGAVQMPHVFRNLVHEGDILIVSKGLSLFRAIGEFTGDYEFHPRADGRYSHRRAVRWHWVDREGVDVGELYSRRFSRRSIYLLEQSELNIPALERYMNGQRSGAPAEPEPFVLIIDEINRANISKVFGELITLLEPDKRLGQLNEVKVRLPYSGDEFGVPSNLHILATMNTADRSIALLDTALRRRFTFREILPDPSVLEEAKEKCGLDLPRILETLNERIEYLYDREHRIGHGYLTDCETREDVDAAMRDRVIPLLAEYFFEDWGKIAAVLGDAVSHDGPVAGRFLNRSVIKAPPGMADEDDLPRFRWEVRSADEGFDYAGLTEG